jgi:hypothetical protein
VGEAEWVPNKSGSNGSRITVTRDGIPWIVNTESTARDIAASADGSIWVIGNHWVDGSFSIHQCVPSTGGDDAPHWIRTTGGAMNIALQDDGKPWVVNMYGSIYRNRWE